MANNTPEQQAANQAHRAKVAQANAAQAELAARQKEDLARAQAIYNQNHGLPPPPGSPSFGGGPTPAPGTSGIGFGGGPTPASLPGMSNVTAPNPQVQAQSNATINAVNNRANTLQGSENAQDPNLQFLTDKYKDRLSADNTTRAIDRATGATRSQAALLQQKANQQAAATGRGPGAGAAAISDQAQRNLARQSADISLGREGQLDALTLGGLGIMSAQGQQNLARQGQTNQFMLGGGSLGLQAAMQPAQLALQQQGLGLQQWQAQTGAANNNAQLQLQQQQMQQQAAQQNMQAYLAMLQSSGYGMHY